MESIASLHTSTSSSTRKRRRAITDAEKKAIRDWWAAASPGQKSHKKLRAWFQETHYHTISQSSISEILSDRYERLDKSTKVEFADLFQQIASAHADGDCEPESGDETPQVTPVSLSEALAGLATLRLYEKQQQDGSRDLVRTLNRFERELQGKRANRGQGSQQAKTNLARPSARLISVPLVLSCLGKARSSETKRAAKILSSA